MWTGRAERGEKTVRWIFLTVIWIDVALAVFSLLLGNVPRAVGVGSRAGLSWWFYKEIRAGYLWVRWLFLLLIVLGSAVLVWLAANRSDDSRIVVVTAVTLGIALPLGLLVGFSPDITAYQNRVWDERHGLR